MAELKQFVITLFNLQLWDKDKSKASTRTSEWMRGRLSLFEKYTLPCMKGQTLKDYTWLCLFDKDTPEEYLEKIAAYRKAVPQFTPVFFSKEQAEDRGNALHEAMQRFLSGDEKFIVTTNVDNDDSIDFGMLARVRREIETNIGANISSAGERGDFSSVYGLYNCLYGYQYFTGKRMVIKMKYPHNHFQTICESPDNFMTIKGYPHTRVRKMFANHDIADGGRPQWMEVVHSRNVNNDYRIDLRLKNMPVWKRVDLGSFGIDVKLSAFNNTVKSLFVIPCLFMQTAVKGIRRHLFKKHSR